MTTAVIIQARIGSSRLPGKVLEDLHGRTVLAHVLARAAAIGEADVVCCAIPADSVNDPVAAEADSCGAHVVRGSEDDVLDRYVQAARALDAELVLRVTSDCPLIDPAVCDAVIRLCRDQNAAYACNNMPPSWPHGLDCECMPRAWLERAWREAARPSEREHVTQFLRHHPDAKKVNLPGPGGGVEHHRWTLDTPADLAFLRALFPHLPDGPEGWDWTTTLAVVEAHPEIAALNAGQDREAGVRKSLAADVAAGFTAR